MPFALSSLTAKSSKVKLPKSSPSSSQTRTIGLLQQLNHKGDVVSVKHVKAGREILIGRDRSQCQIFIDDPHVSARHLRIYTIVYDNDSPNGIDTLVYAEDLSRNGTFWNGSLIGRGRGSFLLSEDDFLKISADASVRFKVLHSADETSYFDAVHEHELEKFGHHYIVTDRLLGAGSFGKVFMAIEKQTRTQLACKIVDLRPLRPATQFGRAEEPVPATDVIAKEQLRKVKVWAEKQKPENKFEAKVRTYYREAEILASIRHPNIIGLEKVIVTDNTIYLFQDLVTGGDLFSYIISKNGKLSEVEAAVIIRQIVLAVAFLHSENIVHRDLKPDNILMTESSTGCRVVLTDFGAARRTSTPLSRMVSRTGTDEYNAPEVAIDMEGRPAGYTKAVDMWSLGCVAAVLLTGASAFVDPVTRLHSDKLARQCNLDGLRNSREWQAVRERPKDFVEKLLTLSEVHRMTASQALDHDWFSNDFHRSDFNDLYQRTVKYWVPRPARSDLIQFHEASSLRKMAVAQGVVPGHKRSLSVGSKSGRAVEAHGQPFARKMHAPMWPRRRSQSQILADAKVAVQESWPSSSGGIFTSDRNGSLSATPTLKRQRSFSLSVPSPRRIAAPQERPLSSPSGTNRPFPPTSSRNPPPLSKSPSLPKSPRWNNKALTATVPLRPINLNVPRTGDPVKGSSSGQQEYPRGATRIPPVPAFTSKTFLPQPAPILKQPAVSVAYKSVATPPIGRSKSTGPIAGRGQAPSAFSVAPIPPNRRLRRRSSSVDPVTESSPVATPLRSRRGSVFDIFDDTAEINDRQTSQECLRRVKALEGINDLHDDEVTLPHHGSVVVVPADSAETGATFPMDDVFVF